MAVRPEAFIHVAPQKSARWQRVFAMASVCGVVLAGTFALGATLGPAPMIAVAQFNGSVIELPSKLAGSSLPQPVSRQSGLRISVDSRWANTYGYRPVEVTVSSPLGAMKADRSITIYLRA